VEFFRKIFSPLQTGAPARVVLSLTSHFKGVSGVEWSRHNDLWEAIFFDEEITKIARFDPEGKLLEYRVNISPDSIPSPIYEAAMGDWEIMNCIAVYSSDRLDYELIVRDTDLIRYQMWVDSLGNRVKLEKL
jgi:hypothetical protein